MATVTFNPLVAVDFTTINTTRSTTEVTSATSYDFDTAAGIDIDMEGTGFTFDGSDNLTGGTLTRIDIDIAGNQGAVNGGDINISGLNITATPDLAGIDNGAFSLFGVALQGNDTFLMAGLTEDADTPTATSRIFGDDLSNLILFLIGGTNTNSGGDDVFSSADNRLEVSGDVFSLNTSGGLAIGSTYNGGDDTYFGAITEELHRVAGDAWTINRTGVGQMTLNGGDDEIDLGGNTSASSFIAGDVNEMNNGRVNGGDDELVSDDSATPEVSGDVRTYNGGTLVGGDDTISAANAGRIGGDVMFVNASVPAGVFTLTGGDDEIQGGAGDDLVGGDVYDRNSPVDNLIVGGDDVISGGAGDDDLFGDVLFGDGIVGVTGGNDALSGGAGNDELQGQGGDDLLDGGSGNDTIVGGTGDDTLTYATASAGVVVNLVFVGAQNTVGAGTDRIAEVENLTGSRFDDTLRGNNVSNALDGGRGNDMVVSGAGEDNMTGGSGDDTLSTAGQTDDLASGGSGDDVLQSSGGGNILVGNGGSDTVSFANIALASTIDLAAGLARQNGGATADALFQIENASGGGGNDDIVGDGGANVLRGLGGNDEIVGGNGADTLDGGDDQDTLLGGEASDELSGAAGNDRVDGDVGNDTLSGGEGADTLFGRGGVDEMNGDAGDDDMAGGGGADTLNGGGENDDMRGDSGGDEMNGGAGNDTLDGGSENDILDGGEGTDTFIGGSGADTMVFAPVAGSVTDIIADFRDTGAISDDLIDVTAYSFASVAGIVATANGDDVILNFGAGDRVRLQDYLLTNVLGDVDASDFLL